MNSSRPGSDYCVKHADQVSFGEFLATAAGAVLGTAVSPGWGTVAVGYAANKLRRALIDNEKRKARVFLSFDFDHDRGLRDLLLGQAKLPTSPFEVINHSLKEAAPEAPWEAKARAAIQRSDIVVVLVGRHTYRAPGVLKEVAMAREAGVRIVQIIGYTDGRHTKVPNAGRLYAWDWQNLRNLLR